MQDKPNQRDNQVPALGGSETEHTSGSIKEIRLGRKKAARGEPAIQWPIGSSAQRAIRQVSTGGQCSPLRLGSTSRDVAGEGRNLTQGRAGPDVPEVGRRKTLVKSEEERNPDRKRE